jgi:hypothetical protein
MSMPPIKTRSFKVEYFDKHHVVRLSFFEQPRFAGNVAVALVGGADIHAIRDEINRMIAENPRIQPVHPTRSN